MSANCRAGVSFALCFLPRPAMLSEPSHVRNRSDEVVADLNDQSLAEYAETLKAR